MQIRWTLEDERRKWRHARGRVSHELARVVKALEVDNLRQIADQQATGVSKLWPDPERYLHRFPRRSAGLHASACRTSRSGMRRSSWLS
jgi:hypothetical protein